MRREQQRVIQVVFRCTYENTHLWRPEPEPQAMSAVSLFKCETRAQGN